MKKLFNILPWVLVIVIVFFRAPSWIDAFNREGGIAPIVTVKNLSTELKEEITLPLKNGHPSILIFWATWCSPCTFELARFQKAIENKELDPAKIFAISIEEDEKTVIKISKERGYTFNVLLDHNGEAAKRFNVAATPTIVNVLPDGKIKWIGSGISPTVIFRAKSLLN